ncbi:MAG: glycosyltransferase [Alphaproteobacteria bacterium]|nr:glycosyltransferase [Alphaproteobacteria bacterium]
MARESGGPAQACQEMARAVAARGHDVAICTTNWAGDGVEAVPTNVPLRQDGVTVTYFPVGFPRSWKPSLAMAPALRRDLPAFDVVHLHSLYMFHDWLGGHLCRRFGVPYIVRPHGMLDPYIRARHRGRKRVTELLFQNRVLRHAAAIHYTSDVEREISEPFAQGAPGRVVPLGVDLAGFDALPPAARFHERFPETRGRRIVLFLSRLHFKKGLDLLIPAFARLAASDPSLHLVIAGPDDGMLDQCRAWARRDGVPERVSFTGMLRGEDKLAAFAAASVFALPSYSENFGIAVVEAMAAGLPVVISDQVNIWREVEAGGGARVVGCDTDQLAQALATVLGDAALAADMAAKARATVRRLYHWDSVAAALEEMYRDVVAGGRAASLAAA